MLRRKLMLAPALLAACAAAVAGCGAKEKAVVQIHYELQPDKGLPLGMKGLAVAQVTAETGSGGEAIDEVKWQEIVGEMMHRRLTVANEKHGLGLTIADRASTKDVMTEKDLALAGISEGAETAARTKLVDVQGLIRGRVIIKVEKHVGRGRTIKAMDMFGYGGYGGRGGRIDTEETTSISRTVTVQPSFHLVDASTGKDWYTWTPDAPFQQSDEEKPSMLFGSGKTEADLDPRDHIVARCIEEAVFEFTSHLIPIDYDFAIEVESSGNEDCAEGVKLLRAEEYDTALEAFQRALAEDDEDHKAVFCAGVACEALGRFDDALSFYKQACMGSNRAQYVEARDRVKQLKDRVRTSGGEQE